MAAVFGLRFALTEQDYVRANQGLRAKSHRLVPVFYTGMALFELGLIWSLASNEQAQSPLVWLLAVPLPLLMFWVLVLVPLQIRRTVRGNEHFLSESAWELGDDGILVKNPYTETKYDWGSFQRLIEDSDYFFLQHSTPKKFYKFIPKRAFVTPEQITEFRELVSRQIAEHRVAVPAAPRP